MIDKTLCDQIEQLALGNPTLLGRIDQLFVPHDPLDADEIAAVATVHRQFRTLAIQLAAVVPDKRELAMALSHLEEGCRAAVAGIQRHGVQKRVR